MKLMNDEYWKKSKYFSKNENWGNVYAISRQLINRANIYRAAIGVPIIVHNSFEKTGHALNSRHYQYHRVLKKYFSDAFDFHFKDYKVNLIEAYICAERYGFNGIGLYPNAGRPFMHLDTRPIKDFKKRWIQTDTGEYVTLNYENLRKYIMKGK